MVELLLNRGKPVKENLNYNLGQEGPIPRGDAKVTSKSLVDNLKSGNVCVVNSTSVNGMYTHHTHYLFKVGEKGLFVKKHGGKNILTVDVELKTNPASNAKEAVVLEVGSMGYKWLNQQTHVSLSYRGIDYQEYFNEHTFSNSPGSWITHPHGSYLESIMVGQTQISKKWREELDEIELRLKSIPFILPTEYLRLTPQGKFGDIYDASAMAAIKSLHEIRIVEKPLTGDEFKQINDTLRNYQSEEMTPQQRGHYTRLLNKLKNSDEVGKKQKKLLETLSQQIRFGVYENILLNSISSVLNHSNYYRTKSGYGITEINGEIECNDDNDEFIIHPEKSFELIPSKFQHNIAYAIPKDEAASKYLLRKLVEFNDEFPDTIHIPEAKENYVPNSVFA